MLRMPSTSSLCVSYGGHIPMEILKLVVSACMGTLYLKLTYGNTFLNPLLVHNICNSDKESLLNFEDDTLGESESG